VVDLFNETPSTKGQFLEGAFKFSGKLIGGTTPKICRVTHCMR
jgi:hypothetical protein